MKSLSVYKFFISKSQVWTISLMTLVLLFFFSVWILLLFFLIIAIFLFTHRKNDLFLRGNISNTSSLFYSPVNGVVRNVTDDKIKIFTNPLQEGGVYSPATLEVSSIDKQGLTLTNDENVKIRISFFKLIYSRQATIWLEVMDRAKCGACIGFQPYGGIIEVVLDSNTNILIKKGDKVKASHTIIAEIKDINDK